MSSIKLTADSGGGTFEVKAPASSGNTRVLTLPDAANGTVLTTTNPKSKSIIQRVQRAAASEVILLQMVLSTSFKLQNISTTGSNILL